MKGDLFGEPQPLYELYPLFDLDVTRGDAWPMPTPAAPKPQSLWARIWEAIREPWVNL